MRCAFARARPHEVALSRGSFDRAFKSLLGLLLTMTMVVVGVPALAADDDPPTGGQQRPSTDNRRPDENHQSNQTARPESGAASTAGEVCEALAKAATTNDLPVDFFTRLIWQESHFKPDAVSRKGAKGIAQFMPATARSSGLEDPFNSLEAIAKSGELLRGLRVEFGNLGLAAAAYNAGSGRVRGWLGGRRRLPQETRAYVRFVTGRSVEEWTAGHNPVEMTSVEAVPCNLPAATTLFQPKPDISEPRPERLIQPEPDISEPRLAPVIQPEPDPSEPKPESVNPWAVVVVGGPTPEMALARYREWQSKYPAILADREPHVIIRGILGEMGAAQVRVRQDSRAGAEKMCAALLAAGTYCDVLRD